MPSFYKSKGGCSINQNIPLWIHYYKFNYFTPVIITLSKRIPYTLVAVWP